MNKEKTFKKLFVTLVTALLLVIAMSATSMAASKTVAKIGSKSYTSLESAIKNVKNGQTITLKSNVKVTSTLNVTVKKSFTLNLNGKTLSFSSGKKMNIKKGNTVTIKGKGTVKGSGIIVAKGAKLNIEGGTFKSYISNKGTMTISGGTFNGTNAYYTCLLNAGTLTISGGTFNTKGGERNILVNQGGSATIEKGSFTTTYSWDMISNRKKGYLEINAGTFTAPSTNCVKSETKAETVINGGIFRSDGCCVNVDTTASTTICGGDFELTETDGVTVTDRMVMANNGTLVVAGGSFTTDADDSIILYADNSAVSTISGVTLNYEADSDSSNFVIFQSGGSLTITDCTINGGVAKISAIAVDQGCVLKMTGCTVSINTEGASAIQVGDTSKASITGGAISVYNASAIYRDKTATVDLGSDVAIDGVGQDMNTIDVGE